MRKRCFWRTTAKHTCCHAVSAGRCWLCGKRTGWFVMEKPPLPAYTRQPVVPRRGVQPERVLWLVERGDAVTQKRLERTKNPKRYGVCQFVRKLTFDGLNGFLVHMRSLPSATDGTCFQKEFYTTFAELALTSKFPLNPWIYFSTVVMQETRRVLSKSSSQTRCLHLKMRLYNVFLCDSL